MTALGSTPQQHAENLLRKEWDAGRVPNIGHIADESALTRREVEAIRDRLLSGKKAPLRPVAPPTRPVATPTPDVAPPAPVEPRWRAGLGHPVARIARKAQRVEALITELVADLDAETERDALRAREAKLLDQLAKVRAELSSKPTTPTGEPLTCPDCGRVTSTPKGMAIHRGRDHKETTQ